MKIGISGQALGDVMSFEEIVRLGKGYGVRMYEIWPSNAPGEGESYGRRNVAELKRIQDGEGVEIYTVTLGAAFNWEACRTAEGYASLLCEAIDAAAELGAHAVNHYLYHINLSEVHDYGRMEAFWAQPLEHARQAGVVLALENEAHDGTRTPELMRGILDHFDDPSFLTNFDATNYYHASAEGFPAGYEILRDKIGYVHIKNGCLHRYGAGQPEICTGAPMSGFHNPLPIQYTPLPDGAVNIPGLLTRIQEDGCYDGPCTFEPHTHTPESVKAFYDREIAVISLFYAVGKWNSYFDALIFIRDANRQPLQIILRRILVQNSVDKQLTTFTGATSEAELAKFRELVKYGLIVVSSLPVLCIYPFVQKYFVKGVMIGSVKG